MLDMNQGTNNQNRPQQRPQQRPAGKPVANSPFTENWVKVRSIKNGVITLPSKELVSGIKIEPKNIFIMEQNSQDIMLNSLKNCYNTFNFEFWFIAADRPVDISVYRSQLELALNNESNPAIRKLLMQDLNKADMFVNNQVIDTEYFILIKDKNPEALNDKIRTMINGFATCGMVAGQTSDEDLRNILDNFLNGGVRTDFGTAVLR